MPSFPYSYGREKDSDPIAHTSGLPGSCLPLGGRQSYSEKDRPVFGAALEKSWADEIKSVT